MLQLLDQDFLRDEAPINGNYYTSDVEEGDGMYEAAMEDLKEVIQKIIHFEILGKHCAIIEADPTSITSQQNLADLLTERELQIATLVSIGRVNKQIARQLHISPWTVATHIRRIFYKLGVDSRAAMVYRCASLIKQVQTEKGFSPPPQN